MSEQLSGAKLLAAGLNHNKFKSINLWVTNKTV